MMNEEALKRMLDLTAILLTTGQLDDVHTTAMEMINDPSYETLDKAFRELDDELSELSGLLLEFITKFSDSMRFLNTKAAVMNVILSDIRAESDLLMVQSLYDFRSVKDSHIMLHTSNVTDSAKALAYGMTIDKLELHVTAQKDDTTVREMADAIRKKLRVLGSMMADKNI